MATLNLTRFSQPGTLKNVERAGLIDFLLPYAEALANRGFNIPEKESPDEIDYEALVSILMTPSDEMSKMLNALFFIHEMGAPETMDSLLEEADQRGLKLLPNPNQSPVDVAIQVWLQEPAILERKHAERFLARPRSFEYFQTTLATVPQFNNPTPVALEALESDLDDCFEERKRGRGSKVFLFPKGEEVWILLRHGEPYRREGTMDGGEASSVLYRPEKFDVLIYDVTLGEIRINANSKWEKELYRAQLGKHLFGDEAFFPNAEKYSLEPLRSEGLSSLQCIDIEGLDWARLKEIQYLWGGTPSEVEVRKSDDVFAALKKRKCSIPKETDILSASFLVKFNDSKTPRTVTIRPPLKAQYTRDSDSAIIEAWLIKRGFILNGTSNEA